MQKKTFTILLLLGLLGLSVQLRTGGFLQSTIKNLQGDENSEQIAEEQDNAEDNDDENEDVSYVFQSETSTESTGDQTSTTSTSTTTAEPAATESSSSTSSTTADDQSTASTVSAETPAESSTSSDASSTTSNESSTSSSGTPVEQTSSTTVTPATDASSTTTTSASSTDAAQDTSSSSSGSQTVSDASSTPAESTSSSTTTTTGTDASTTQSATADNTAASTESSATPTDGSTTSTTSSTTVTEPASTESSSTSSTGSTTTGQTTESSTTPENSTTTTTTTTPASSDNTASSTTSTTDNSADSSSSSSSSSFLDDDVDESLTVTEDVKEDEEKGKKHFLFYSDASNVYAYDPVVNSSVVTLVAGLSHVQNLAIDEKRKYLFISELNNGVGTVKKYQLAVNFTDALKPVIGLNATIPVAIVYTGKEITGLTVDQSRHLLFIADQGSQDIVRLDFTNESAVANETLYSKVDQIKHIHGIACNPDHKELFWGNNKDGNVSGGVLKAPHKGEKKNITTITKNYSVNAITYDDDYTFYISENNVYALNLDRVKQYTVNEKFFTAANALTVLDDYVYVADSNKGIYLIRQNDTAVYDTPRLISSAKGVTSLYFATLSSAYYIKMGIIAISSIIMFTMF